MGPGEWHRYLLEWLPIHAWTIVGHGGLYSASFKLEDEHGQIVLTKGCRVGEDDERESANYLVEWVKARKGLALGEKRDARKRYEAASRRRFLEG